MVAMRVVVHVVHKMSRFFCICIGCTLISRRSFLSFAGGIPWAVDLVLCGTCIEVVLLCAWGLANIGHAIFWAMFEISFRVSSFGLVLACHLVSTWVISA